MSTMASGALHGELVQIHGLSGTLEVRDTHFHLLGIVVEANGMHGWASWSEEKENYAVQTLDGLLLEVPEAHLASATQLEPEDGGFNLVWPKVPATTGVFAHMLAECLQAKGFCVIQMDESNDLRRSMLQATFAREDFALPPQEFEEAYFGRNLCSKAAFLGSEPPGDPEVDPLVRYDQYLMALASVLRPVVGNYLGFAPHDYVSGTLLRIPLVHDGERELLSPGPVSSDDIEAGVVEQHLDFVQRRRLCAMYLIDNDGGVLELHLREDAGKHTVRLPISRDRLVVFRCDALGYSYKPNPSQRDVVLQTWMMEEPAALKIDSFIGDQKSLEAIVGGPHLPVDKQVHVMTTNCRFPANSHGTECAHLAWTMQTDCFLEISKGRFDMDLYYVSDADQFASGGRSVTKHTGCLEDREWVDFDNGFFGMEPEVASIIPPCQRVCLEMSVETLHSVGYKTLESMRGNRQLMVVTCDIGLDWEPMVGLSPGLQNNPDAWLKAGIAGNSITSSNRLHFTLGLAGPATQIDTACSASMVGSCMAHAQLRKLEKGNSEALVCGFQNILTPWPFIGLSGAGMVGRTGRCLFFDQSGNGFARGEGWGGLFLRSGDSVESVQDRICVMCSSYVNQDGRSASLTAPNGPSQQAVVRGSLANVNLHPDEIVCTENHGTGTALGDPIEAGTVKAVFGRKRLSGPIPVTSGKSHMGHLEPAAGTVGIIKTITGLVHAAVPPNVHLRHLNAHIEVTGFPGLFPTERVDVDTEYHYGGANGFGFGGTNARTDFWARRLHRVRGSGPRECAIGIPSFKSNIMAKILPQSMDKLHGVTLTCMKCQGLMCWLCGAVPPKGATRHRCSAVREEFASYDICSNCFLGGYQLGSGETLDELHAEPPSLPDLQSIYLAGTWDAWSDLTEMTPGIGTADADVYETEITLGETRVEQFQLVIWRHGTSSFLHPAVCKAGQHAHIAGPVPGEPDGSRCWQINGWHDGQMAGTVYRVRFAWGETRKWIMWEATDRVRSLPEVWQEDYQHTYSVLSSINDWKPLDMKQNLELSGLWEIASRIPLKGEAEFVIQRDQDPKQVLYPLRARPKEESVPVVGPDDGGSGKRWLIFGKPREIIIFRLCIMESGNFSVQVIGDTMGEVTWQSPNGCSGVFYDLAGSFNDWRFTKSSGMEADPSSPGIRHCRFKVGGRCKEEFQIVVNQNWGKRLYPEVAGDPPGTGLTCGPDAKGTDRRWQVVGYPGQTFEVVLDLTTEDTRKMVTCVPLPGDKWAELDDGKTEWTTEEWAEWEAEWAAYGEDLARTQYGEMPWPPEGDWPGADKRLAAHTPALPQGDEAWVNPWTEDRLEE